MSTTQGGGTEVIERNPQTIVADGVRSAVVGAFGFIFSMLDAIWNFVGNSALWFSRSCGHARRLGHLFWLEAWEGAQRVWDGLWRGLAFFICDFFADHLGDRCSGI